MRILIFFLFLAGFIIVLPVRAQTDSLRAVPDTVDAQPGTPAVVKDSARLAIEKMPRTAATRSAILPGLGQIYNKRWWKVPIIYGGFIAIGLALEYNQRYYKEFLGEVQYRAANNNQPKDPKYAGYSFEGMVAVKDTFRRNRDLSILGLIGMHAINIVDAYVDAKFFRFDISDDLSFRIEPAGRQPFASRSYLVKINLAL